MASRDALLGYVFPIDRTIDRQRLWSSRPLNVSRRPNGLPETLMSRGLSLLSVSKRPQGLQATLIEQKLKVICFQCAVPRMGSTYE